MIDWWFDMPSAWIWTNMDILGYSFRGRFWSAWLALYLYCLWHDTKTKRMCVEPFMPVSSFCFQVGVSCVWNVNCTHTHTSFIIIGKLPCVCTVCVFGDPIRKTEQSLSQKREQSSIEGGNEEEVELKEQNPYIIWNNDQTSVGRHLFLRKAWRCRLAYLWQPRRYHGIRAHRRQSQERAIRPQ